jgi:hypothetical protein
MGDLIKFCMDQQYWHMASCVLGPRVWAHLVFVLGVQAGAQAPT